MKKMFEQPNKNEDFINVSILLAVTLCIGLYLIVTTAIIAKDGVTFINYARQFEIAPIHTMVNEYQHPGYPTLILAAHKITGLVYKNTSILSWIYCAQSTTLTFRFLAVIVLYYVGKHLLGARLCFWAILILILLPQPAEYGSDALSDWPSLFLMAAGLLLLFNGTIRKKWWIFAPVGFIAAAGYLIRPECALLVVLGSLWLGLQLLRPKLTMGKSKTLAALALMLVSFIVIAGPYMKLKGAMFPKKNVGQFNQNLQQGKGTSEDKQNAPAAAHATPFTPVNIAKAFGKFVENVGETLMWFFVPALLIGAYKWFRSRKWYEPQAFFVIAFIALNALLMIWLYCKHGYMSDRHTLPLLTILIFYVPVGLQELAAWFRSHERFWFLVLFLIGAAICAPKLFTPIRIEKQGYRAAAEWLKANTDRTATIAVPDKRINFYAQRQGPVYDNGNFPANTVYTVIIPKHRKEKSGLVESPGKIEYKYVGKGNGVDAIIYRNF